MLDVQALVIVDDVAVHVLRAPLQHRRRRVLVLRLHRLETVALADVLDAGVVGVDAALACDVAKEECAVVGAEREVLLVRAEHAAC